MIRGIHGLFYSSDAQATRAFFRDKVRLPGSDIGQGWWIFDLPAGDLGVHPVDHGADPGEHNVSFYCDDIHGTVRDLKSRGVKFPRPVADHGYGLVTYFKAPGGLMIQLYEPKYEKRSSSKPHKSGSKSATKRTAALSKSALGAKRTSRAKAAMKSAKKSR
jgi:catechol 2,3-dioxygenase-like lactoylglutathione lyase family enzyme